MSLPVITLYSKERCVQCTASERKLTEGNVTFIHADATTDENRELAIGLGYFQAPVMTVVKDGEIVDHWSGYRPDKIEELAKG